MLSAISLETCKWLESFSLLEGWRRVKRSGGRGGGRTRARVRVRGGERAGHCKVGSRISRPPLACLDSLIRIHHSFGTDSAFQCRKLCDGLKQQALQLNCRQFGIYG